MKLNEVFQHAYPWKWTHESNTSVTAEFVTDAENIVYVEFEYEGEDQWSFSFAREATAPNYRDKTVSSTITGQGDAYKIFATVKEVLQEFTNIHDFRIIYFTAHEPSRQRLYAKMLPQLAQSVNLDFKISQGHTTKRHGTTYEYQLVKK